MESAEDTVNAARKYIEAGNENVTRAYMAHQQYEQQLRRLKKRGYLTVQEQLEEKSLKIRKLKAKQRLADLIAKCERDG